MAYHVFEINAFHQLTLLESVGDYRSAKSLVRELRQKSGFDSETRYRMMFAADAALAERLLKEKREARPMGEHD